MTASTPFSSGVVAFARLPIQYAAFAGFPANDARARRVAVPHPRDVGARDGQRERLDDRERDVRRASRDPPGRRRRERPARRRLRERLALGAIERAELELLAARQRRERRRNLVGRVDPHHHVERRLHPRDHVRARLEALGVDLG